MEAIKSFFVKLGKRIKANFGFKSAVFLGVFAVMLAADLITKHCAEQYGWNFTIIPGFIEAVSVVRNDGASLGMGSGTAWAQPLFIAITFIMLPVFIAAVLLLPERATLLKFCIYMALAGALGNLVDRLAFGYVRDFISMDWGFVSYVCNLADVWLMVGLVIAVVDLLFLNEWAVFPLTKRARDAQKKREEEKPAADNAAQTVQPAEGGGIAAPDCAQPDKTAGELSQEKAELSAQITDEQNGRGGGKSNA